MSSQADAAPRPLRADAERNRQRILNAAGELFAAKGLSVGLDEIARHAGVGVATAYRRYPDKEQLIRELFEERLGHLVARAEQALADEDPWAGLVGFMESTVELQSTNRGLKELVFGSKRCVALTARTRASLAPLIDELVLRTQASGDVRADLEATDVPLMQFMLSSLADFTGPGAPGLWRRYVGIMLDGLRASAASPLAVPPLDPDRLDTVIRLAPRAA